MPGQLRDVVVGNVLWRTQWWGVAGQVLLRIGAGGMDLVRRWHQAAQHVRGARVVRGLRRVGVLGHGQGRLVPWGVQVAGVQQVVVLLLLLLLLLLQVLLLLLQVGIPVEPSPILVTVLPGVALVQYFQLCVILL